MAALGRRGNPNGMFGRFTTDPYKYELRRLLVKGGGDTPVTEDSWELVKIHIEGLYCNLELPYENSIINAPVPPPISHNYPLK